MRNAGLPVKLALVGFVVICGLTALLVAWVMIVSGEKPERIEILQAAQRAPDSPPDQDRPPGLSRTPDQDRTPSPPDGALMSAGGPSEGPVPKMPGGECPKEFPLEKEEGCYDASTTR